MKRIFAIGGGVAAPILLLFLLPMVACNPSKPAPTDDSVSSCAGRCGRVNGVACGSCSYGLICNTENYCVEMTGDSLPVEDADTVADSSDTVITDADIPVGCPSLKYYANVKAAGFPFKDGDGKITFCRSGCDTPTENDPQCVKNLWTWINWKRYQEYTTRVDTLCECYPWPCELPDMKAASYLHECDRNLASQEYTASPESLYDLKVINGHLGILMGSPKSIRAIEYDIAKDVYLTIAHTGHAVNFGFDRFVFYTTYEDYVNSGTGLGNTYIATAKKNGTDYKYEVIYDDTEHMAQFSWPPLIGEKWVILNVLHEGQQMMEVVYAKVDEWKWHDLKVGQAGEGNIVGDRATFVTAKKEVYVCDLDKLPFDPATECLRIDRTGDASSMPRLNEEDKNQLVYFSGSGDYGITFVDLSKEKPQYELLPIASSEQQPMGVYPEQFRGNLILYNDKFSPVGTSTEDYKACFYRIDKKKSYCPTKYTDTILNRYDMGFNSFDGNYQLWKIPAGRVAGVRDISCYCEKEGVCPFDGMK